MPKTVQIIFSFSAIECAAATAVSDATPTSPSSGVVGDTFDFTCDTNYRVQGASPDSITSDTFTCTLNGDEVTASWMPDPTSTVCEGNYLLYLYDRGTGWPSG